MIRFKKKKQYDKIVQFLSKNKSKTKKYNYVFLIYNSNWHKERVGSRIKTNFLNSFTNHFGKRIEENIDLIYKILKIIANTA